MGKKESSGWQKELFHAVANPLKDGLIHDKNGLCFTDSVARNGKGHIITGSPDNGGLLPHYVNIFLIPLGYFKQNVTFLNLMTGIVWT